MDIDSGAWQVFPLTASLSVLLPIPVINASACWEFRPLGWFNHRGYSWLKVGQRRLTQLKTILSIIKNETFSAYILIPIEILSIFLGSRFDRQFLEAPHSFLGSNLSLTQFTLDFLLGFFFFNIGLELRYELAEGALRDRRTLVISGIGAGLGMLFPALIYILVNNGRGTSTAGWGITMATDLPMVLAVISIFRLGRLRGFILALATIDDVGSIIVLSVLYKAHIHYIYLVVLIGICATYFLSSYLYSSRLLLIGQLTVGLFVGHRAGIQTSLVAVFFGILTFNNRKHEVNLHQRMIKLVEPFSAFMVVPIFVFVSLFRNFDFSLKSMGASLVVTLVLARLVGKPIGIFIGILIGKSLLKIRLPFSTAESLLVGALGTLGLAVSLIFADNDFSGIQQNLAVMAILLTIPFGILLSFVIRALTYRD